MQLTSEFTVQASPATVYPVLLDFERIGPCVPGASVGPAGEDGAHQAEIAVRLGPMRLTYRGTLRLEERDDSERRATMLADVREVRGQGAARAQMTTLVTEHGAGSRVISTTEVQLSGRAAQMGAGIVEDVAARLVADMAGNLERLLETEGEEGGTPTAPAPADGSPSPSPSTAHRPIGGLRLLLRALWHRLWHGRRSSASETR